MVLRWYEYSGLFQKAGVRTFFENHCSKASIRAAQATGQGRYKQPIKKAEASTSALMGQGFSTY
jgi:hypothetical protein